MQYAILPLDEYKRMCDIVRESTGKEGSLTSTELLNNMLTINGKTVYYDEYWDYYQDFGNKTDYSSAFTPARGFNLTTFRPKYKIKPTVANNMFQGFESGGIHQPIDLVEFLDILGIDLDFSVCTSATTCFRDCKGFTHLGVIDLRNCSSVNMFYYRSGGQPNHLQKIDKFILSHHVQGISMCFVLCTELTSVGFEMADENSWLGGGHINFNYNNVGPNFDALSVRKLIGCLERYAGTDDEYTYTFTISPLAWANVNADTNNPPPQGDTWQAYVQTLGWNVG